ncbi:MAG: hypothetical protein MJ166_11285 [Clostridia bacterium]|nr:hypothetical protein [Clostridia bacterium]
MDLRRITELAKRREKLMIVLYILVLFVISRFSMLVINHNVFGTWSIHEFIARFNIWDTGWYVNYYKSIDAGELIQADNGQAVWAFFPLYPLCIWLVSKLFGGITHFHIIGMSISSICFMVSEYFAYKYVMLTRKSLSEAYVLIGFMSLGIYSFYFSIVYTEALFMMLLIFCFYFLKKKEYIKMGIAGALLSATRSPGVMFVFVVLVNCIMEYFASTTKGHRSFKDFVVVHITNMRLVLGTFIIPSGIFSYMLYLKIKLGDGFAFVNVERGWHRENIGVFRAVKNAMVMNYSLILLFISFIVTATLIGYMFYKKKYDEATLPLIILVMGCSSHLQSLPRYMIATFVLLLCFVDDYMKFNKYFKVVVALGAIFFEFVFIKGWITLDPFFV